MVVIPLVLVNVVVEPTTVLAGSVDVAVTVVSNAPSYVTDGPP